MRWKPLSLHFISGSFSQDPRTEPRAVKSASRCVQRTPPGDILKQTAHPKVETFITVSEMDSGLGIPSGFLHFKMSDTNCKIQRNPIILLSLRNTVSTITKTHASEKKEWKYNGDPDINLHKEKELTGNGAMREMGSSVSYARLSSFHL